MVSRFNFTKWQGFRKKRLPGGGLAVWNKSTQSYEVYGDEGKGITFTYFSAQGFYAARGKTVAESSFFSNGTLGMQIWNNKGSPPKSGNAMQVTVDLGSQYNGQVPVEVLIEHLSEVLGVKDFRKSYANWKYRYEVGIGFRKDGQFKKYLLPGMPRIRKKGNVD